MDLEGNVRPDAVCDGGDLDCGSGLLLIIREAMAPLPPGGLLEVRSREISVKKVTLPGPYLLSRSTWVKNLSDTAYPTREALAAAGADVVQFDEPVLTELVFAGKSATRTFMCAAFAASASPEDELAFAVELVSRVVDGIDGPVLAPHVCRGNWSQKEEVLLQGSYEALMPYFRRMRLEQFVLEYATPRAGPLEALKELPPHAHIGFRVVNPRTAELEPPEAIVARVKRLAELTAPAGIFLNPDCGFGTFADRPVGTPEMAFKKLCALSRAAAILRENPSGKGPLTA